MNEFKFPITKINIETCFKNDNFLKLPRLDSSDCNSFQARHVKLSYDWPMVKMNQEHCYMNPIIKWIYFNLSDEILYDHFFQNFLFEDDADAMAFKLRWA